MKTTGETGRKVPVPRRCTRNGAIAAATESRCSMMPVRSASSTWCGGSSVMWVGMCRAAASPTSMRYVWSSLPQGSGTGSETPIMGTRAP